MKRTLAVLALAACAALGYFWTPVSQTLAQVDLPFFETEPDIPALLAEAKKTTTKEQFLEDRANAHALLRGIDENSMVDPQMRSDAIKELERQQSDQMNRPSSAYRESLLAGWNAIGPNPIISGAFRYSGRVTAIAVHPTNPNIVYVGVAQGGVYRTTNGGTSWTPIMDSAESLAIGAIAVAPSDPETVYVGTGEPNFSSDSFFGVGVYRIENASTAATLVGPHSLGTTGLNVLAGRGISEVIVHPTDKNTIWVATTSGVGGIGGAAATGLPSRGIYRSTNAAGPAPIFTKLSGLASNIDGSVRDIAIDPTNPDVMLAGLVAAGPTGGIYRSTNATAAAPTFTQVQSYVGTSTSDLTTEFAVMKPAGAADAVFYAASGYLGGRVLRSTDGGATWVQRIDNDFCSPQCFYNIAIAVDPINPDQVYVGGAPSAVAEFSTNGGQTFTEGGSGVHVDTHVLAVAPSSPTTVYLGTDGGIYKSTNSGASYSHLNTAEFSATQFMGISVHPSDPNFTVGGTQDNGTNFYNPAGDSWTRIDSGDGGYSIIDSNAADLTNVRVHHTYFSRIASIVGYATRGTTTGGWSFRGCQNGVTPNNGINCNDSAVLFYAPLESGPGNPNTVYYGTDRLYRSSDLGVTHTVVSQAPISSGVAISAIGISPQNDNIRVVGLRTGGLFGTNTGSATLTDLDPTNTIPNGFIARIAIHPTDPAVAYVTLSSFGVGGVYKTVNLNAPVPVWTNVSGTIPQIPVSAFLIDPANPSILYAGTDIGMYVSPNGGTTWEPFGTGFPRVAIFDIAKAGNQIRIATHGRGMWQVPAFSPAAIPVAVGGRVTTPTGLGLRNAIVTMTDTAGGRRTATTSSFGIYSFADVAVGQSYTLSVGSKRYRFTTQNVNVTAAATFDFTGQE